jgi:hypothetical protein
VFTWIARADLPHARTIQVNTEARARTPYLYAPTTQFFLQAPKDGWISETAIDRLLHVPGVAGFVHTPAPGTAVRRTVDLLSSPGTVYLTGDSAERIDEAHVALRELEAACMYHS